MIRSVFFNIAALALLVWLGLGAWQLLATNEQPTVFSAEKMNLAIRRTVHHLFEEAGDSLSQIPPVQQITVNAWRIRMDHPFNYDRLPALLQDAMEVHGIQENYDVSLLRCSDEQLQLGYNYLDYIQRKDVPCSSRDMSEDCYWLQVSIPALAAKPEPWVFSYWFWLLAAALTAMLFGLYRQWRMRPVVPAPEILPAGTPEYDAEKWISFGHSRLDMAGQTLICGATTHALTYREAKLLQLMASHPNQLLERSFILEQVWADEGVLVGRSVDVFMSRLRKFLRDDATVQIVAVHGVGYRLEVK